MKTTFIVTMLQFVFFLAAPENAEAQSPEFVNCLGSSRDFRAEGIKIVSAKLRRKGSFKYPQIAGPRTPQERKFNADVLKVVLKDVTANGGEEYLFSVSFATPEFVSVHLISTFCGASCHAGIIAFNFDLKTGKQITKLSELFKPKSNYLKTIASYSVGALTRCSGDELDIKDDWFMEGTKPTAKNYSIWSLTRDGVRITFPEYQIAPGAFSGVDVVVPYSHLKGMLREDVEWFRLLN